MPDAVSFKELDWKHPRLEEVAQDLALFIHNHKSLMDDLNSFMRISSTWWERKIQRERFHEWRNSYIRNRKTAPPDRIQLAEKLYTIKKTCETVHDWNKMRGLIPEKIFEFYFDKKHANVTRAYGAKVFVLGDPIVYQMQLSNGKSFERKTVDAGSWDGTYGEFVEVKFQPERFNHKDIGYLYLLENKLNGHQLNHTIFLVSFDKDISFVRKRLESKQILSKESAFKVLGPEEFVHNMIKD